MGSKILIIVGGNISKLDKFKDATLRLGLDVTLASLNDINYEYKNTSEFSLKIENKDISDFKLIYIRMIGKRIEDASLLVDYAHKNRIKVVDHLYESELLLPSSISKAVETRKLIEGGVVIPKSFYSNLTRVIKYGERNLDYPFIIKSTSGRKAREVWLIENEADLKEKQKMLIELEKNGMRFFAQAYIKASQRVRVLTLGGVAIAAITRPTKWRKRIDSKFTKDNPEGIRGKLDPIPYVYKDISEKASKAVSLDICGVDILHEDDTDNVYVIEANAAPAWKLIEKDWKFSVEEKILEWLNKL